MGIYVNTQELGPILTEQTSGKCRGSVNGEPRHDLSIPESGVTTITAELGPVEELPGEIRWRLEVRGHGTLGWVHRYFKDDGTKLFAALPKDHPMDGKLDCRTFGSAQRFLWRYYNMRRRHD